jgi:hypothetical protein
LTPSRRFLQDKNQVLRLALTASRSNKSCAESVGIRDAEIAFAFDMECNEVLTEWEMESETNRIESVVAGMFTEPSKPAPKKSGPIVLNAQVHT